MKTVKKLLASLCVAFPSAALCAPCLPLAELVERDRQYEEALRVGDTAHLETWLADDYVRVHLQAAGEPDDEGLVQPIAQDPPRPTR